ncbi:MAG: class III extradiol ring-cleavage dioxygenase, partial [Eubacteriales bacterium]|nr:class III extradiol ring-cleavage dioxygenase [Eubacteriales bacterium]
MNAIESNQLTEKWRQLGEAIPSPRAILAISAHWYVPGQFVNNQKNPRQIYDMYGFPKPLYDLVYPVNGSPELAARVVDLTAAQINNEWGIDHGTWSVLVHLFPNATIPVVQLSVDQAMQPAEHFALGQRLRALRDEGVLILGSGNIVHNLRRVDFQQPGGAKWAERFDLAVSERILSRDFASLFEPDQWSEDA